LHEILQGVSPAEAQRRAQQSARMADVSACLDQEREHGRAAAQQLLILGSKVESQRAADQQRDAEVRDLAAQLASTRAANEQLQGRLGSLTDSFNSTLAERDQQLAAAAAEHTTLSSRLEAAETLQTAAAQRQAALQESVCSLRAIVQRQEAARRVGQRAARSRLAGRRSSVRALRERVAGVAGSVAALTQRAEALEAFKTSLAPQVGAPAFCQLPGPASSLTFTTHGPLPLTCCVAICC
jgi:chromosome segregation ATPase